MMKSQEKSPEKRHYFFLNPYDEYAFTKCPKCSKTTKIRKFPLVIHIEPKQIFLLNKECRFCSDCDIIIARKSEVESLMTVAMEENNPAVIGNEYTVFGTMDRKDWLLSKKDKIDLSETLDRAFFFEDVLNYEVIPGGWYREGYHPLEQTDNSDG